MFVTSIIFFVLLTSLAFADMVGAWLFEESSGDTVKDVSEYGNNGTLHNAIWVDGKFGSALEFKGS